VAQQPAMWKRGHAGDSRSRRYGFDDCGAERYRCPFSDPQQIRNRGIRPDPDVLAYYGVSVNDGVVTDKGPLPDLNVVRYERPVADSHIFSDRGGLPENATCDDGVGEDLDMILDFHTAAMRHLQDLMP
jgi:hypothetical protein